MKFTEKELDEKITSLLPKSILVEVKDFQETAEGEGWDWQPNSYETLDHFIDITEGKECSRYKRTMTKIQRSIGIMSQVKEGDYIMEWGSNGSRVLKVGTWTHSKRYDQLIKEK